MAIESEIGWQAFRARAVDILTDFGPGYGEAFATLHQLVQLDFVIVLVVTLWVMLYLMNSVPDSGK